MKTLEIEHGLQVGDDWIDCILCVTHYPARRGDSPSSWSGPTPDDPEENIVDAILIDDEEIDDDSPVWEAVEEEIDVIVDDYFKGEER